MLKRGFILAIFLLIFISFSSATTDEINNEFKRLANYASEYETGNIDYVQLLLYSSSIQGKMNELLGATGKEEGGVLKQEQIKSILGEPLEETKWVWLEGEDKEIKLDNPVPVWKKIIYDGKKIQIRLNAWPSIFSKKKLKEGENKEINPVLQDLEGKLVYRLHYEIEFKKSEEQLDIQSKILDIKNLAEIYGSDPSTNNAEELAKETVNAEMAFKSYFSQSGGKCEDIMSSIFGTENKRQTQKMLVEEFSICEGENFEVIARMEMCDECESNWINIDIRVEGRGPGFNFKEESNTFSPQEYENKPSTVIQEEIKVKLSEIKQFCDNKDFKSILNVKNSLMSLNEAWNQKSKDIWIEMDKLYNTQRESMSKEERFEFDQNYGWIKQEQEKRKKIKELSKVDYEKRKQFYLSLLSGYDVKEYYFTQVEYQKRLVEEFKERGEEICDNNQDDNENGAIDCSDDQCGGKICGKGSNIIQEGNESREEVIDLYCIEMECKLKEEIKETVIESATICQELPPIECPEGSKVYFSRYDNESNCPIETSCFEEVKSCEINEDCSQPGCGKAECIENKCEVTELTECKEHECIDGDEKICESDGKIVGLCSNGFWQITGECSEEPEVREDIIVGNECISASDCGNDNVCNNGICQVLPSVVIVDSYVQTFSDTESSDESKPAESIEHPQETEEQTTSEPIESFTPPEPSESTQPSEPPQESEPSQPSEPSEQPQDQVTGNFIFEFIGALFSRIAYTGAAITGFQTEEAPTEPSAPSEPAQSSEQSEPSEPIESETTEPQQTSTEQDPNIDSSDQPSESQEPADEVREDESNSDDEQRSREEDQRRKEDESRREEDRRREQENRDRCKKDCARPCIEKCIRDECGDELTCVVSETQKKCESTCIADDVCIDKCMKGGDWWKEYQNKDDNKQEKGVFQVGGNCRTSQGKTEGFVWFNGWGDPFEKIQPLKNKYYSGNNADWCKVELENLIKQRQEFEKGFNQEFITWFFESYLANSADNWEQASSGIYELYWRDVDLSREMAYRLQCLQSDQLPNFNLINVKYETEFGSIEFWEEIKPVRLPGIDKEMQVISPYMKIWIFPSKEFIIYEMKEAMENHEFPGSPEDKMERKNEEGLTIEEKETIKQNTKLMEQITKIAEKYGGSLDMAIQLKDYETNQIVFNLYVQINEEDIIKFQPMLPEEVPGKDVEIEIDFNNIYEMIYESEKEMSGTRIESPPWDDKETPMQAIEDITDGVKMFFKVREIINSAKISPPESEKDIMKLIKRFMIMMMTEGGSKDSPEELKEDDKQSEDKEGDLWDSKEVLTGQIIFD